VKPIDSGSGNNDEDEAEAGNDDEDDAAAKIRRHVHA
jgi:hypothetical protein